MKTVARLQVPEEAYLVRSYLEAGGVPAQVFDEHVVQLFWTYSDAIGGVRVVVADQDEASALALLKERREAEARHPSQIPAARAWPMALLISICMGVPTLLFGRTYLSQKSSKSGEVPSEDDV